MQFPNAIRLLKEACSLKHLALNTEKSYIQWLTRYAAFLRDPTPNQTATTEKKIARVYAAVTLVTLPYPKGCPLHLFPPLCRPTLSSCLFGFQPLTGQLSRITFHVTRNPPCFTAARTP